MMRRKLCGITGISRILGLGLHILFVCFWLGLAVVCGFDGQSPLVLALARTAGLLAVVLLFFQYALAARIVWYDKVLGLDRLLRMHAVVGILVGFFAGLHPLLLYSARMAQVPGIPELHGVAWLGVIGMVLLWGILAISLWRGFLEIPWHIWRRLHYLTFLAIVMVFVHAVSLSWELRLAQTMVLMCWLTVVFVLLLIGAKIIIPWQRRKHPWQVTRVKPLNHNVVTVELQAPSGVKMARWPGQFAFVRFLSGQVSREEHPFTIVAGSEPPDRLAFAIKQSGDYTRTIHQLQPGDRAIVDGPYGRFTYAVCKPRDLVLIAGGIGITPLLSMLRDLAASGDHRSVILLWANRTGADMVFAEEWQRLIDQLPQLKIVHILSEEKKEGCEHGFIDQALLTRWLGDIDRLAEVFLCGPPPMMTAVEQNLRAIGFPRRRIHTERFSL